MQLFSKIDNSSLNTTHLARDLDIIIDEYLTFSDQLSSFSKSCYSHIRDFYCIRPYLNSKITIQSLPPRSTPNLTTVTLFIIIFPSLKQIVSNRFSCLALLWLKAKAPKFSHITPILISLHWLKINERIEYKLLLFFIPTKFSQPAILNVHKLIFVQSTL